MHLSTHLEFMQGKAPAAYCYDSPDADDDPRDDHDGPSEDEDPYDDEDEDEPDICGVCGQEVQGCTCD